MKVLPKVLSCVVAGALLFGLTACGESSSGGKAGEGGVSLAENSAGTEKEEGITLSMSTFQSVNNPGLEAAIRIAEEMTGNQLELELYPDDQFENLLKTKLSTGDTSDLFIYYPVAKLLPGSKLAELSGDWIERIEDPTLKDIMIKRADDNATVCAPYGSATSIGIAYNKTIFGDSGISVPLNTYSEFVDACAKLEAAGITPIYMPDKEVFAGQLFLLMTYPNIFEKDPSTAEKIVAHESTFAECDELVEQNKRVQDLTKYMNEDYMSSTQQMAFEAIAMGNAAMTPVQDYMYNNIAADYPEQVDEVGFMPFTATDDEYCVISGGSSFAYFVSEESPDREAAQEFLNALMSEEAMTAYYESNPGLCPLDYDTSMNPWNAEMAGYAEGHRVAGNMLNDWFSDINTGTFPPVGMNLLAGKEAREVLADYDNELLTLNKAERRPGWE